MRDSHVELSEYEEHPLGLHPTLYILSCEDQGFTVEVEFRTTTLYDITDMYGDTSPMVCALISTFVQGSVNSRPLGEFEGVVTASDGAESRLSLPWASKYLVVR